MSDDEVAALVVDNGSGNIHFPTLSKAYVFLFRLV